jgi:hypothetical protein
MFFNDTLPVWAPGRRTAAHREMICCRGDRDELKGSGPSALRTRASRMFKLGKANAAGVVQGCGLMEQ